MAKLIVAVAVFIFCVVLANAAISITTFSDSTCTTAVGFWQSTDYCGDKKRAVKACAQGFDGTYYSLDECIASEVDAPTTPIPAGWQAIKYTSAPDCNMATFKAIAVAATDKYTPVGAQFMNGAFGVINATISCTSGLLTVTACYDGCLIFENVAENACKNYTESPYDLPASGSQNTCIAPPSSEPPMMVATPVLDVPVSGPGSAPQSSPNAPTSTPAKKSDAAVTLVGSALLASVAIMTLL